MFKIMLHRQRIIKNKQLKNLSYQFKRRAIILYSDLKM